MSPAQGGHLAALAEHHLKSLLCRQGQQVVQLELDFGTLVVSACFQNGHCIRLDQSKDAAIGHQVYFTVFPSCRQVVAPPAMAITEAENGEVSPGPESLTPHPHRPRVAEERNRGNMATRALPPPDGTGML